MPSTYGAPKYGNQPQIWLMPGALDLRRGLGGPRPGLRVYRVYRVYRVRMRLVYVSAIVPRGPFLALGRAGRKRHVDIRSGHLGSPLVDSPWRSGSRSRSYRSARRGRVAPRARVGSAPERGRAVLRTLPYTAQTVGRVRPTPASGLPRARGCR